MMEQKTSKALVVDIGSSVTVCAIRKGSKLITCVMLS